MIYSYWLSKANNGWGDNPRNGGDTSSQGSLRLELKRSREQLAGDHAPGPEAVARRRLATDDFTARSFPAGRHMTSLSPWAGAPSSVFAPGGQFDHLGGRPNSLRTMRPVAGAEYPRNQSFVGYNSELGEASELPILNHAAGLPSFSRSGRFAGIDSRTVNAQHFNMSDANRRPDDMYPNGMSSMFPSNGAYNNPKEACMGNGRSSQLLSDYGSYLRNEANVSDKGVENMRRVLGKEQLMISRSPPDATFPKESSNFTLMGEQVERSTGTLSSTRLDYKQQHEKMAAMAPQGCLFASAPHRHFYAADNSSMPTWDDANLSSSLSTDACKKGYLSFGSTFGSDHAMPPAAGFTGSDQKGSGTTLPPSFEVSNAVMQQEAMCNAGNNPAEHATSLKAASKSGTLKRKDRNKNDGNVFPNNVKSILATGIFDGVPVKYVSWDRTKNVRGTIQGTGYVCWCKDCDKKKIVNAYQLEQHAGSKSKHPNDHIYFSNGKSVYGVVQELKNTPSDKLLEVIPTITGCGINEGNLSKWKGSFQAARRELQRIFGSDPEEEEEEASSF